MCQFTNNFYSAVRCLAGNGPVKQRLLSAYTENLEMLREADAPEQIRERLLKLRTAMHSVKPLSFESAAAASVRKMSKADAAQHALNIVAMFSELVRVKATGEILQPAREHSDRPDRDADSDRPALN